MLPDDVRWCSMCKEPVREFSARPVTPAAFVGTPSHQVRTSRWRATDLTFGPVGRLTMTAICFIVLYIGLRTAGGPASPTGLWFFMGWFIAASMVLKQTWQKVRLDPDEPPGRRQRLSARFPRLGRPLHGSAVTLALVLVGVTLAIGAYVQGGTLGRFGIVVLAVMAGLSAVLIWLTGV
jgi:hypothetical protein